MGQGVNITIKITQINGNWLASVESPKLDLGKLLIDKGDQTLEELMKRIQEVIKCLQ